MLYSTSGAWEKSLNARNSRGYVWGKHYAQEDKKGRVLGDTEEKINSNNKEN